MGVTVPIVQHGTPLNTLLGHRHVDHNRSLIIGGSGLNSQFQRVQHTPRIAVGHIHEVLQSMRLDLHLKRPISPLSVSQRPKGNGVQILFTKRFKAKNATAAHKG